MNYLVKALALNDEVRAYVVDTTEILNEAIKKHDLWPSAASVLGKTMTMGVIMGAMLKGNEGVTIKINGNGPIGNVIVDADARGNVRGYVDHPHVNFLHNEGGLHDGYTIGNDGFIDVIKDIKLKDFFTSSIALTGDLAKDFTYYFYESEQTPSAVSLGVLVDVDNKCVKSGGMIFQLLPGASEEAISKLEKALVGIPPMSTLLKEHTPVEILHIIFNDDFKIVGKDEVRFHCPCNKQDFAIGLMTLGVEELTEILHEDKNIETVCHYCGEKYQFNEDEINNIIEGIKRK